MSEHTTTVSQDRVELFDECGLNWQHVSPKLRTVRVITATAVVAAVAIAVGVGGYFWRPALLALVPLVGLWLWFLWWVGRQVRAITWLEREDALVIRTGIMFRSATFYPYGRLQFVEMNSGPLGRRFSLAGIVVHTAASAGTLPGLDTAVATSLRERLSARGDAQRVGL